MDTLSVLEGISISISNTTALNALSFVLSLCWSDIYGNIKHLTCYF
jgi:hypothetical protein